MKNNSIFRFQRFDVQQDNNVFKVGTDAVLLGILTDLKSHKNILEIGTGTGIISLILAQRFDNVSITGIEQDKNSYNLTKLNFENSIFSDRLFCINQLVQELNKSIIFDYIICNPPFFEYSENNEHKVHSHARAQKFLTYEDLIKSFRTHLSESGKSSFIFPYNDFNLIINILKINELHITKKIIIYGIKNSEPKRIILEVSKIKQEHKSYDFIIRKDNKTYSDEYLSLTSDFHVFKKL